MHMYHLLGVAIVTCDDVSVLLLQKLSDVAPSSSECSTVDLRHFGKDGEEALDSELEESTDPEACFTPGDAANSLFTIIRLPSTLRKTFSSIGGKYNVSYNAPKRTNLRHA